MNIRRAHTNKSMSRNLKALETALEQHYAVTDDPAAKIEAVRREAAHRVAADPRPASEHCTHVTSRSPRRGLRLLLAFTWGMGAALLGGLLVLPILMVTGHADNGASTWTLTSITGAWIATRVASTLLIHADHSKILSMLTDLITRTHRSSKHEQ